MAKRQSKKKPVFKSKGFVLFFLVFLVILGTFLIVIYKHSYKKTPQQLFSQKQRTTFVPPTPTPAEIPYDSTIPWKTYTNTQYNFSFQYPGNWTLDTSGGRYYAHKGIAVSTTDNKYTFSFVYNITGIGGGAFFYLVVKQTPITINGISFVKIYVNHQCGWDPNSPRANPQDCFTKIDDIELMNPESIHFEPSLNYFGIPTATVLQLNGVHSSIGMEVPWGIPLNSPVVQEADAIFSRIISTMSLPTKIPTLSKSFINKVRSNKVT